MNLPGYKLHELSGKEKGTWSMSPEMAVRVGKATNTSAESWLYMQMKYDLWHALQSEPDVEILEERA
jgi:addiction module HigA family antidote